MTAIAAPRFFSSTIGKKVIMAISGVIFFGYTIGHMLGNLQVYQGADKLNAYAHFLHTSPKLLWGTRVLLILALIAHFVTAVQLKTAAMAARPIGYQKKGWREASLASRTMMLSGIILLAFVVYHILHFTTGHAHPTHPNFSTVNVYANFIIGFRQVAATIIYIVANLALGLHLWHGTYSAAQSLGLRTPRYAPMLKAVAMALTFVVIAANLSFPIAVQAGVIK